MRKYTDQALHFIVAMMFLAPAATNPECLSLMWAGFGLGAMREIGEHAHPLNIKTIWKSLTTWDAPLDLLFWTLGGLGTSVIFVH